MPATALGMQVQARPGFCYGSYIDCCCLECRFASKEQWGFCTLERGTADLVTSHTMLTKEALLHATSAGDVGPVLHDIQQN